MDLLLARPVAHLLPWDLSLSDTPRNLPVFILLISYYLHLRFLSSYIPLSGLSTPPEASWERIHRKQFFWDFTCLKKPFFFIPDESMGGGLLTIGFSMRCSTGLIRQTPDTNIMNGSFFFLLFPFPPPLLPLPLSSLPPFPPLFLLLPETFSRARTLWFTCLFLSGA